MAMKQTMSSLHFVLLLELLVIANINFSFCNRSSYNVGGCIESEKQVLLSFKQGLRDPSNRLASWIGDGDCCAWSGIVCHNLTEHVLELRLRNPFSGYTSYAQLDAYEMSKLHGNINPSLLDLKLLISLDLSGNDFEGIRIPKFLGSMGNLRYLNLSRAGFAGMISHQLGNLSNLECLDLGWNKLHVENLHWLSVEHLLLGITFQSCNL
ncbi:hypothetical protein Ddye_027346 [Dipteronia dyeriana]|uniref:Leucine-rich repeat-containing N-terminal plant-type domain-containing protein n=1 Tax=Dipteronia dyeriana TaxID=168575 RepID=A0AAD9TP43_9ROSI|nr:hypothetical protein Ddye_027346 [Dipteronia dyeriana]